jgi:uncharacterized membrane protein
VIVFYVMLAAIVVARMVGAAGIAAFDDWHAATRAGLAVMFLFTGAAHFTSTRADLVRMVPPSLSSPGALVTLTGVAEVAGAIGLLVPALARLAALLLIVLLAAMFPANIHAWRAGHTIGGRPHTRMLIRLPLQILWMGLLWWSTLDLAAPAGVVSH